MPGRASGLEVQGLSCSGEGDEGLKITWAGFRAVVGGCIFPALGLYCECVQESPRSG